MTIKDGRKPSVGRSFFMKIPLRLLLMATVLNSCCSTFVNAQTATVIPANLAAGHVGEYATVEGVVAKVFTSKKRKRILLALRHSARHIARSDHEERGPDTIRPN